MNIYHTPVLLNEVVEGLKVERGGRYIDATVGGGGHTAAVLKLGGRILAIDCDPEALKASRKYLTTACPNTSWRLALGNFKDLGKIALEQGFGQVEGILFDLGVSSHQLETANRGFSFLKEGPLDMRMDPRLKVKAADLVNGLNRGELENLFKNLAQENHARAVAQAIVDARRLGPVATCQQLAQIVSNAKSRSGRWGGGHPATLVFQALRMAVNDELDNLELGLSQAVELLRPRGRLAVISFHSGEDRIVKNFLKEEERNGRMKIIVKKPIGPSLKEVEMNSRSRSARLRVGEKDET